MLFGELSSQAAVGTACPGQPLFAPSPTSRSPEPTSTSGNSDAIRRVPGRNLQTFTTTVCAAPPDVTNFDYRIGEAESFPSLSTSPRYPPRIVSSSG
jgi:hypothetical protein